VRYPAERLRGYMLRSMTHGRRVAEQMALNLFCAASPLKRLRRSDGFVGFYFGGRHDAANRESVLAALQSVDGVCIFTDVTATKFLAAAQPDIYVKGGDYTLETLNQDERRAVESSGGKIVLVPFVPGKSTTGLLEKISRL